jgi:histidyl-tRNA synthetase
VAEAYGFQAVETPAFESVELFLARSGPEIKSSMLTFHCDHEEFALRPEMTAPVCRLMASGLLDTAKGPHKLYYIAPCFRYCRPQSGRQRQFTQAGIECLGQSGADADAEVIAAACQILRSLGIENFRLKIGNIGIFGGLLSADLDPDDRAVVIGHLDRLIAIDEKCRLVKKTGDRTLLEELKIDRMDLAALQAESDYSGPHAIAGQHDAPAEEWADLLPLQAEATFRRLWDVQQLVPDEVSERLMRVSRLRGPLAEVHKEAQALLQGTPATRALDELLAVCRHAEMYDLGAFEVVLGIARGFTFYTSTVFEISSAADNGGVKYCGGGRYDRLVEEFGGPSLPATGCAFRFDSLVEDFVAARRWSPPRRYQLYLLTKAGESYATAVRLAESLRRKGVRVGVGLHEEGQISATECEQRGTDWLALMPPDDNGTIQVSNGKVTQPVAADADALARLVGWQP